MILTEKEQIDLVTLTPSAIRKIIDPCVEAQVIAAHKAPTSITYIRNPSDEAQLIAIKNNFSLAHNFERLGEDTQNYVIRKHPESFVVPDLKNLISNKVVENNKQYILDNIVNKHKSNAIYHFPFGVEFPMLHELHTRNINWQEVYSLNGIRDVRPFPMNDKDMVIKRLTAYPHHIACIKNPSEEIQRAVIEIYSPGFQLIHNPTFSVQEAFIRKYPSYISYINNPSPYIQCVAVSEDPSNIQLIYNSHISAKRLALENINGEISTLNLRYYVANLDFPVELLEEFKEYIIMDFITNRMIRQHEVNNRLVQYLNLKGISWSEIDDARAKGPNDRLKTIINKFKNGIMEALVHNVSMTRNNDRVRRLKNSLKYLDSKEIDWPELSVIKDY